MNNAEKIEYINYCCKCNDLLINRYNQTEGLKWYIRIKELQLKSNLLIKNILGIKYKHFTKYDWKN